MDKKSIARLVIDAIVVLLSILIGVGADFIGTRLLYVSLHTQIGQQSLEEVATWLLISSNVILILAIVFLFGAFATVGYKIEKGNENVKHKGKVNSSSTQNRNRHRKSNKRADDTNAGKGN